MKCKFATVRYKKIVHRNGRIKYRRDRRLANGLLVGDRFYLPSGHYMSTKRKGFSVKEEYDYIPVWVTEELLAIYKACMEAKKKVR